MEIPRLLSDRPRYKGMPIPFTTYIDEQGVPDFKVTDTGRWNRCVSKRLCGLCGKPLMRNRWIIGGERTLNSHYFFDPPMHKECAEYAFETCPFLVKGKGYSDAPPRAKNIVRIPMMDSPRVGIVKIADFRFAPAIGKQGQRVLIADQYLSEIRWREFPKT